MQQQTVHFKPSTSSLYVSTEATTVLPVEHSLATVLPGGQVREPISSTNTSNYLFSQRNRSQTWQLVSGVCLPWPCLNGLRETSWGAAPETILPWMLTWYHSCLTHRCSPCMFHVVTSTTRCVMWPGLCYTQIPWQDEKYFWKRSSFNSCLT